ncbi:MAG: tetratricopeptide repeat protein [Pirellulaceae bacterium]
MSKSFDHLSQEKDAPILRIAASDQSASLDEMLLQGRSLSGNERNCVFLNTLSSDKAGQRFATISAVSGLDFPDDGQAAAQVDWDHDGDVDLVLTNRNAPRARFMRNENGPENAFVQFQLKGNGTDTNLDAIGARITLVMEAQDVNGQPLRLLKTLRAGDGYLTQSTKCVHFGLGANAQIKQVEIRWPNGNRDTEVFAAIEPGQRYVLVQGSGVATAQDFRRKDLSLEARPTVVPAADVTMRIPLMHQFLAPTLSYVDFSGTKRNFSLPENEMVLVNLWSSTCEPCVKELKEFGERHDELTAAGVRVLALNIDDLQTMADARVEAQKMAERMKFPFQAGMAPAEVISELQRLHNALLRMNRPLPMPTSFLIDRKGRLHTIYKGAVAVDTLLGDAQPRDMDLLERFASAASLPGTVLRHPLVNEPMERNEGAALIRLGKEYIKEGKLEQAEATFKDALEQVPDSPAIHNQLARVYEQQGRRGMLGKNELAMKHYRHAIALDPDKPGLRINLAQVLIRNRKYDEAAGHLNHALTHAPEHADAHYNLGLIYSSKRDPENAKTSYEKALAIKPDHPQALFRLGLIYESRKNIAQAKKYYQRAVDQTPRSALLLTSLARMLVADRDLSTAEEVLRQAIRYEPGYANAHFQLGQVLLTAGKLPEARQQFLDTLRIKPDHRGAIGVLQQLERSPGSGQ